MTHKHHIFPKYKGGTDDPVNLVEVSITQHAMFHYCNWKLWGDKRDWLAWKGLSGEIGKEEIIKELRSEGSRKGLEKSMARGNTPARQIAARRNIVLAIEAARQPEIVAKRKETLRAGIDSLSVNEKSLRFGREQTPEVLKSKSDKQRKWKSLTVKTPTGTLEVEGCIAQIAEQLNIPRESMQPLLRKGKVKHLGLILVSKNPW